MTAAVATPCEHHWVATHEPGHVLYWVRQCSQCHVVDWHDLDYQVRELDMSKLGPLSPKFHGAWIGALGGLNVGAIIVGIIQTDIVHHALSLPVQTLIESIATPVVAALGAYLAPLLPGLKVSEVQAGPVKP